MLTSMGRARRARAVLTAAVVMLAAAACARVSPHVALPSLALGEPSFFPTLEAYARAPIVGGNRVGILLNGEDIFPAQLTAIRAARRSITLAQYSYEEARLRAFSPRRWPSSATPV